MLKLMRRKAKQGGSVARFLCWSDELRPSRQTETARSRSICVRIFLLSFKILIDRGKAVTIVTSIKLENVVKHRSRSPSGTYALLSRLHVFSQRL